MLRAYARTGVDPVFAEDAPSEDVILLATLSLTYYLPCFDAYLLDIYSMPIMVEYLKKPHNTTHYSHGKPLGTWR